MALSEEKLRGCIKRLLLSRMRILCSHGFYGLLLMHMNYAISENVPTVCSDGVRIVFGPDYLENLSDSELDCVMMDEILHIVLKYCFQTDGRDEETSEIADDIAANLSIPQEDCAPCGLTGEDDTLRDIWVKYIEDAAEAIRVQDPYNIRGLLPAFAGRMLRKLRKPQTDWRTILNDFVQEEVVDYSFFPPDRRFDDGPFFLPDLNVKEDRAENILFMIDVSGSMSDDMITAAYSEVKGAIDQFDGRLRGWLGFFDAAVVEPIPFQTEEEFEIIQPTGGGGTDFRIIFEYVYEHMADCLPAGIIILTDGYAPFPREYIAGKIPVLWLLNNEKIMPPWGKIARITV